jgi:peptidoglycan/LPS O-acetylase OafA/YrhL
MSRFLNYIHYLRGIAIVMIVGVHARGYEWEWGDNLASFNFFVTLFDNGTILFVFIAGFLFQHLNKENFSYLPYLKQKAKFVVLPYLLFSIPIIVVRLMMGIGELSLEKSFDQEPLLYKIFFFLVTGLHMVPFWFMPMIFLFYLSSFLLHKMDNKYFYQFVFPIVLLLGLFTYRPVHNANPLLSYLHFLSVYLTGMWAAHHHHRIVNLKSGVLWALIFAYLLITVLELSGNISVAKQLTWQAIWETRQWILNIYVFKAILLCFILLITFYKIRDWKSSLLNSMAAYSFGIYFIHYYFISLYREVASPLTFNFIGFVVYFILLLTLSWLAIYVIKKITGPYSRYLTGS